MFTDISKIAESVGKPVEEVKIGFTCSTFDLFHAGHIVMLQEAKSLCDYLICGLLIDPTVDRPINQYKLHLKDTLNWRVVALLTK